MLPPAQTPPRNRARHSNVFELRKLLGVRGRCRRPRKPLRETETVALRRENQKRRVQGKSQQRSKRCAFDRRKIHRFHRQRRRRSKPSCRWVQVCFPEGKTWHGFAGLSLGTYA